MLPSSIRRRISCKLPSSSNNCWAKDSLANMDLLNIGINLFPKLSADRFRICFCWVYQVNSFVVFNTIKNEIQHLHHCFRVSLRLNVFNFQNFFLDFKNVNSFWDLGEKNLNCILVDVICGFEKRMNKVQQFSEQTSSVNFQVVVRDHKNQKCICTFLERD